MGLYDNLVAREAGQPRSPSVPGGAPGVSRPAVMVNPPAAAQGPVGRPSSPAPPFPGGAGQALPTSPVARPAAAPAGPPGGFKRPAPAPSQGGMTPAQPQPVDPGKVPGQPAAAGGAAPGSPFVLRLDRVPSPSELAQLPPGVQIETPYGTMDERGELQLSPEGRANYQQAVAARLKSYGPSPFAADPNAPKPSVKLGRRSFNPFTGQYSR